MTLKEHLVASIPLGAGFGLVTGSVSAALAAGLSGVLVDADHVIDYIVSNRGFRSLAHLIDYSYRGRVERLFLAAHSWELWLAGVIFLPSRIGSTVAAAVLGGWLFHLLLDQLFNTCRLPAYFFLFRLRHGFARAAIATPQRNLYTDLARRLGLPQAAWTRPRPTKR